MTTQPKLESTPGPWQYHLGRGANPRFHVQTTGGYQIASTPEVGHYKPEAEQREANARLIAASPDLLEALIEVEQMIHANELNEGTMSIVREAISKATGA